MAASAWAFYGYSKRYLATGDIDLASPNASTIRMTLYTSASNAATTTLSRYSQLTNQVATANGYVASGKAFTYTWSIGASANIMRFTGNALTWTAAAGSISAVKFAVLWVAGASAGAQKLICSSQLSTAAFTITSGSTLTITPSATGVFQLA